jgi:hypothetical protein
MEHVDTFLTERADDWDTVWDTKENSPIKISIYIDPYSIDVMDGGPTTRAVRGSPRKSRAAINLPRILDISSKTCPKTFMNRPGFRGGCLV